MIKKLSCFIVCFALLFTFCSVAFAAETKEDLKNEIQSPVVVDGVQVYCPANYQNMAINFVNSRNLSVDQIHSLSGKIQSVKDICVTYHIKSEAELRANKEAFNKVKSIAMAAANEFGISFKMINGVLHLYNSDGTEISSDTPSGSSSGTPSEIGNTDDIIKATGFNWSEIFAGSAFVVLSIVAVVSAGFAIKGFRKGRAS